MLVGLLALYESSFFEWLWKWARLAALVFFLVAAVAWVFVGSSSLVDQLLVLGAIALGTAVVSFFLAEQPFS